MRQPIPFFRRIITIGIIGALIGCSDDFLDINTDPTRPEDASVLNVMPGAQVGYAAALLTNVNYAPMAYVQYLTTTGFFNNAFSRYIADGASFANGWDDLYSNPLPDLDYIITNGEGQGFPQLVPIALLQKAYIYSVMVDVWGDVPFSQATQRAENFAPTFDEGSSVYTSIFSMIDEALLGLDDEAIVPASTDIIYGGDVARWRKMGNALRFKLLVQTRLVNPDAAAQLASLLTDEETLISQNEDDFEFQFGATQNPANQHPLYADHYQPGKTYFMSNYLISLLRHPNEGRPVGVEVNDPRLRYYIYRQTIEDPSPGTSDFPCSGVPDCVFGYQGDGYIARDGGTLEIIGNDGATRSTFGVYPVGGSFDDDSYDIVAQGDGGQGQGVYPMLTNFMMKFLRAEAALFMGTGEDARALLEAGTRASISKVMNLSAAIAQIDETLAPTEEEVEAYVAAVMARYDAAPTDEARLDVVMEQAYLALFGNGIEAWTNYRRTGYPSSIPLAVSPLGPYPQRLLYSVNELNTNRSIEQQTAQQTPVFWDN